MLTHFSEIEIVFKQILIIGKKFETTLRINNPLPCMVNYILW